MVTQLTPKDLQAVPEVGAVVACHGWGSLIRDLTTFPGRNENLAGITTCGMEIFVKKIDGRDVASRFHRALSFKRLDCVEMPVPSPECIARDEKAHVLVYEFLSDASSGSDLARDGAFTKVTFL
ncbi:hypothetical protein ACFV16_40055 [Streptomyces massasporeus]|uniref:hypothetical protein n=1 Tax=Streptomyces massasporeus TaxID=67324 RepID=UPI00367D4595